ncbi:hypothetical protein ACEWPM_001885 [Roseovarius sp. S4756]|uniref:hypothetical protein n=1 Tax=Roseovarius maritimus TaxID=3342637 RepID=UPI0037269EAA
MLVRSYQAYITALRLELHQRTDQDEMTALADLFAHDARRSASQVRGRIRHGPPALSLGKAHALRRIAIIT